MVKLDPLGSFFGIYEFWRDQGKEALVTAISHPQEMWNDLSWAKDQVDKRTQVNYPALGRYFRLIEKGHLPI